MESTMTKSEALSKVYETYSEDELLSARDELDTRVNERFSATATILTLFGDEARNARTTHRRVKRAFHGASHGASPAEALANARRILKQDEIR
jgi:hypothetical protein